MDMNSVGMKEIMQLLQAVKRNDLSFFSIEEDGKKIEIHNDHPKAQTPVQTAVSAAQHSPVQIQTNVLEPAKENSDPKDEKKPDAGNEKGNIVTAPLVGTFYVSPSPEAKAYVKVGDKVKKGQIICIIEAMKLMNEVESDFDGTVDAVLAENATAVGFGQPLFRIV